MLRTPLPRLSPAYTAWNTVARFDDYEGVQHAVDWLSDEGFPVEKLDVVGSDVQLVEGALTATQYDLIARDGTVDRARFLLSEAGLVAAPGAAAADTRTAG